VTPRLVLLGASNLSLGLGCAVAAARADAGVPLEVLAAHGLGRSYGSESRVGARVLPGILQCGLWDALEREGGSACRALLTDLGNDILYGTEVGRITGWLEQVLERLSRQGARVRVTRIPLAVLERTPRWRLALARRVFFPAHRVTVARALERARELDREIARLATSARAELVAPETSWYGIDPIHIARRARGEAWSRLCGSGARAAAPAAGLSPFERRLLRRARPLRRRLLGRELCASQPAARLLDGTTVSLY